MAKGGVGIYLKYNVVMGFSDVRRRKVTRKLDLHFHASTVWDMICHQNFTKVFNLGKFTSKLEPHKNYRERLSINVLLSSSSNRVFRNRLAGLSSSVCRSKQAPKFNKSTPIPGSWCSRPPLGTNTKLKSNLAVGGSRVAQAKALSVVWPQGDMEITNLQGSQGAHHQFLSSLAGPSLSVGGRLKQKFFPQGPLVDAALRRL